MAAPWERFESSRFWTEREHAKQWEQFNEEASEQIKKAVQEIIDSYYPEGRPKRDDK